MNITKIEWTDFSANPLKYRDADGRVVWACVHASTGCVNCYAEAHAHRYKRGGPFNVPTMAKLTSFLDEAELHKMLTAKTIDGKAVTGSRCFVGDMTDIFGEWVPDELLDRLFAVFALRPDVTWQVLTKRAGRMREYVTSKHQLWNGFPDFVGPTISSRDQVEAWCRENGVSLTERTRRIGIINNAGGFEFGKYSGWPLPNVWLIVSCENQPTADERIAHLLQTPAAVRGVSAEPLLGQMNLSKFLNITWTYSAGRSSHIPPVGFDGGWWSDVGVMPGDRPHLDWVIPGGESSSHARPCHVDWLLSLVQQCAATDGRTAVFLKQLGAYPQTSCKDCGRSVGRGMTGGFVDSCGPSHKQLITEMMAIRDRKGGDIEEFPPDLRVREYPRVQVRS